MKKLLFVAVLLLGLASAKAADSLYEVRCPSCLDKQILAAVSVQSNGGYSTNYHGVSGTMTQRNGNFHCPECHSDFIAPIKPDQFVPSLDATPATAAMLNSTNYLKAPKQMPVAKLAGTNVVDELIRTINLPDGSQLLVYRRNAKQ